MTAHSPEVEAGSIVDERVPAVDLLAIGASTGGPPALATLLTELPRPLGAAVLVVQHMADGFIEGLAAWLDGLTPWPVRVGVHGQRLRAGTVTVAPSGVNLTVHPSLRISLHTPAVNQWHVPGIDVTFESVARALGPRAAGVLLTGMGRDGAAGLRAMREAGAVTITQDEATSAVYGMPAAAMEIDAAALQLPLASIGPAVAELVAAGGESA